MQHRSPIFRLLAVLSDRKPFERREAVRADAPSVGARRSVRRDGQREIQGNRLANSPDVGRVAPAEGLNALLCDDVLRPIQDVDEQRVATIYGSHRVPLLAQMDSLSGERYGQGTTFWHNDPR